MNYLLKQKFNIADLVEIPSEKVEVLLVLEEPSLGEIYHRHFLQQGYEANLADFTNLDYVSALLPTAALIVMDFYAHSQQPKLEFLRHVRKNFPRVSVITVGHALEDHVMHQLMEAGVVGHVNRKFSRPFDIIEIAKTILKN